MVRLKEIPNWQNIPVKYGYLFTAILRLVQNGLLS